MKNLPLKLSSILLTLLFLDIFKPLGYSLCVEFLLLGVIFIALTHKIRISITLGIIFGFLKDSLTPGIGALSMLEFPLLCLLIHYLFSYFIFVTKKQHVFILKNAIVMLAVIIHVFINSIFAGLMLPLFSLKFIIQSSLVFLLLDYLIEGRRVSPAPQNSDAKF